VVEPISREKAIRETGVGRCGGVLPLMRCPLAFSPEPSARGVVNVPQDVRLKLQILQSMLDDIADADDADQLAVA